MVVALKMPGKVLTGKKRKKKPPQKENKSPAKKKRTEDEHYTEIRFKFELRDANLTFLGKLHVGNYLRVTLSLYKY